MKVLSLILCALLLFSFVACSSEDTTSNTSSTFSTASTPDESSDASSVASSDASADASDVSADESADASSDVSADESADVSADESADESADVSDESSDTSSEESDESAVDYGALFVGKADTAPVVDGVVNANEYATTIKFDASKPYWSVDSTDGAEAYDVKLHISWDSEFLYTAVEIGAGRPRTYDNTDYLKNRPYIFDRRHVMTAIVPGDPTESRYKAPNGEDWTWSEANNAGLANEWTITAQPDNSNISADHFGKLTVSEGYEYIVAVSGNKAEIYEQKIPWANLVDAAAFTPEAGATIGYAFVACCEEVDVTVEEGEDEAAVYACFGSGINTAKNFSKYVGLTLKD